MLVYDRCNFQAAELSVSAQNLRKLTSLTSKYAVDATRISVCEQHPRYYMDDDSLQQIYTHAHTLFKTAGMLLQEQQINSEELKMQISQNYPDETSLSGTKVLETLWNTESHMLNVSPVEFTEVKAKVEF